MRASVMPVVDRRPDVLDKFGSVNDSDLDVADIEEPVLDKFGSVNDRCMAGTDRYDFAILQPHAARHVMRAYERLGEAYGFGGPACPEASSHAGS